MYEHLSRHFLELLNSCLTGAFRNSGYSMGNHDSKVLHHPFLAQKNN